MATSLVVALVSLALAVVAVLQTFEADEQRDTARQRARLAESRSLAAQALQLVEFERPTAALLAVEARELFSAPFNGRIPDGVDLTDAFVVMSGDEDLGAVVTIDGEAQLLRRSRDRRSRCRIGGRGR